MVSLDDLMAFLHDFMGEVGDKDPHMPNGLQVRGREEVKLLAAGVSASLRLFDETVEFEDAKFMLVACSAFVNYLLAKVSRVEMEL